MIASFKLGGSIAETKKGSDKTTCNETEGTSSSMRPAKGGAPSSFKKYFDNLEKKVRLPETECG